MGGDEAAAADDEADPGVLWQRKIADRRGEGGGSGAHGEAVQVLGFFLEADAQAPGFRLDGASGIFSRRASPSTAPPWMMTENVTTTKMIS
ncbi:MAG: hypothetical protein ACM32E_26855 [Gemmatimonadota bacterium]